MTSFIPDPEERHERRQGLVALVFFGLALLTVYLPAGQQQQVAAVLRSTVLRPFIVVQQTLARTRVRATEVDELQRQRDSLVEELINRTTLVEENRRLRALLNLRHRLGTSYTAASVLRPGTRGSESMFLLDVGESEGARKGAPVITGQGLVGVVREVRTSGAIGMDWTHPDFRASAMDLEGRAYGIVEPRRGDFREEDRLVLTGTPFHTRLEDSTLIVTSGRGGVYPRGIPIGRVDGLAETEAGWKKTYWLQPAVEVGSVQHVLVSTGRNAAGPGRPSDTAADSVRADSAVVSPGLWIGPDSPSTGGGGDPGPEPPSGGREP